MARDVEADGCWYMTDVVDDPGGREASEEDAVTVPGLLTAMVCLTLRAALSASCCLFAIPSCSRLFDSRLRKISSSRFLISSCCC